MGLQGEGGVAGKFTLIISSKIWKPCLTCSRESDQVKQNQPQSTLNIHTHQMSTGKLSKQLESNPSFTHFLHFFAGFDGFYKKLNIPWNKLFLFPPFILEYCGCIRHKGEENLSYKSGECIDLPCPWNRPLPPHMCPIVGQLNPSPFLLLPSCLLPTAGVLLRSWKNNVSNIYQNNV